jgi:gas vesicle protein
MTTTSKIILGIVGAAAAGVAIGMLVAPEKTKELCNKLTSGITDWAGDLKNSIAKTVTGVEEQVTEATA